MEVQKKLPEFLISMLEAQYGNEITQEIIKGYVNKRQVTFRVNTLKTNIEKVEKELQENQIEYEKVLWSKEAFIIKNVREKEIQELELYKRRRNISSKFIINVTTNYIRTKRKYRHFRHGSSSRRKNNTACSSNTK